MQGVHSFLTKQYLYMAIFSLFFASLLSFTVDLHDMTRKDHPTNLPFCAISFIVGAFTSILTSYIGIRMAVYTNARTTFMCCSDFKDGFMTAIRGGQVLGFVVVSLDIISFKVLLLFMRVSWYDHEVEKVLEQSQTMRESDRHIKELTLRFFELAAGFGFGGSFVALFNRVGGGIYTKAADIGADLAGKQIKGLTEDDLNNPGTIADNVGDNVGEIAGMGSDLFGSLAEATCSILIIQSTSVELLETPDSLYFPIIVTSQGIVVSFLSLLVLQFWPVSIRNVGSVLKS